MQKTQTYYTLADILGESLGEEEAEDLLRADAEAYRTYLEFPLEEQLLHFRLYYASVQSSEKR
ncbi:MAG: hypothetical protein HDR26_02245 [Lachnospiraceae bacterium]|nr:hypothetical protein [Lachnospiraceae bacterium]